MIIQTNKKSSNKNDDNHRNADDNNNNNKNHNNTTTTRIIIIKMIIIMQLHNLYDRLSLSCQIRMHIGSSSTISGYKDGQSMRPQYREKALMCYIKMRKLQFNRCRIPTYPGTSFDSMVIPENLVIINITHGIIGQAVSPTPTHTI